MHDYFTLQRDFVASLQKNYPAITDAKWLDIHAKAGSIKLIDALNLRAEIAAAAPKKLLEVGSYLGFSSRWILDSLPDDGSTLCSIDPNLKHRIFPDVSCHAAQFCASAGSRYQQKRAFLSERNMGILGAYKRDRDLSDAEIAEIIAMIHAVDVVAEPFDQFDFAFIDGDHSYRATVLNLDLVSRMMQPGSRIILHDAISWPQVVPAVTDLVAASDGALRLDVVLGADFHDAYGDRLKQIDLQPKKARLAAHSLCDGLAVVTVCTPVTIPKARLDRLLEGHDPKSVETLNAPPAKRPHRSVLRRALGRVTRALRVRS